MAHWAERRGLVRGLGAGLYAAALVAAWSCSDGEPSAGAGAAPTASASGGGAGGAAGGTGGDGGAGAAGGSGGGAAERFPLTLTPGERVLREASGRPFFFHGDTGWSLIAQLTREEASLYLDDRSQKGFTVVLVNLLEHAFADQAPSNAYGDPPFSTPGDYATPNESYFAHVDWVLERAAERGLLVLLAPSYLGWGGGDEGFYQEMVANGATKLEAYGHFLGARYRSQPNILWLHAGDYDPPDQALVDAIAQGILAEETVHLHSAHTARNETASSVWGSYGWLQVDNVYSAADSYSPSLALYPTATRPFFLIEAYYEGAHSMSEEAIRYQAYGALLAGAMGQIFGNNPIWCFGASTCLGSTAPPTTWQEQLDGRGSLDMAVLAELWNGLEWSRLVPDDELLVANGAGAIAARADDGGWALLYTRSLGSVELDMSRFTQPVRADRIDPTDGSRTALAATAIDNQGTHVLALDEPNATTTDDWLVELAP